MKAKVLIGMLCIGLLGFTACDKEDGIEPSPVSSGVSSEEDFLTPQSDEQVAVQDEFMTLEDRREAGNDRVNVNGRYFVSYFANGTAGGSVDVTSEYNGYIFTIDNRTLTVTGNGVNLVGSINIDEDRSVVEMNLPANDRLNDLDPVWFLNDLTPGMIGMASVGMDAPRDAMVLTKAPEPRVAPLQRQ